jgi:hypothetical protein
MRTKQLPFSTIVVLSLLAGCATPIPETKVTPTATVTVTPTPRAILLPVGSAPNLAVQQVNNLEILPSEISTKDTIPVRLINELQEFQNLTFDISGLKTLFPGLSLSTEGQTNGKQGNDV